MTGYRSDMSEDGPGEPVKTDLDPDDTTPDLLESGPRGIERGEKLDWIRKATREELGIPEVLDTLVGEARRAGATPEEIDAALDTAG
ncbi:MAG: hypothetical protein JWO23_2060 [Solirubrobacterales bacterium]|nr:hypothetical protein [Solirubrobacterales bacterium]